MAALVYLKCLLDAGNLGQLIDADFKVLVGRDKITQSSFLERFISSHIKEPGTGKTKEDDAALTSFLIFFSLLTKSGFYKRTAS